MLHSVLIHSLFLDSDSHASWVTSRVDYGHLDTQQGFPIVDGPLHFRGSEYIGVHREYRYHRPARLQIWWRNERFSISSQYPSRSESSGSILSASCASVCKELKGIQLEQQHEQSIAVLDKTSW